MKIVKDFNIVLSEEKLLKNFSKQYFEFKDIESYLELKKVAIQSNLIESKYILFICSGFNEGYKAYLGKKKYNDSLEKIMKVFKNSDFFFEKKKYKYSEYYMLIELDKFLKLESVLYESSLIFRFSSFLGIENRITKKEIIDLIKNNSFLYLFFNKWKKVIDWKLFFDGEHFSGFLLKKASNSG